MGAETWFAIPRWEKLAPDYGEAVNKVLKAIESSRPSHNFYAGEKTGPEFLHQHPKTAQAFQKIGNEQQGHDILIVPCQFGLRHRGRSFRRAREMMNLTEFGLGMFAVGCMLLTYPDREQTCDQLHIDCAGDECGHRASNFSNAPRFFMQHYDTKISEPQLMIETCTTWGGGYEDKKSKHQNDGSASGFLM